MLKAWKRVKNYVKYDLREIIAPSSLPYPPGEEPPKTEWKDFFQTLRLATRDYMDTWKPDKPKEDEKPEVQGEQDDAPLSEDLAGVARSGAASVKPILQQLYRTRAAAYQEAVSSFVQGYREGFAGLPDSDDMMDDSSQKLPDQDRAVRRSDQAETNGRGQDITAERDTPNERDNVHEGDSSLASHGVLGSEQGKLDIAACDEHGDVGAAKTRLKHRASSLHRVDTLAGEGRSR